MFRLAKTWLSVFTLAVFLFATVVPPAEAAVLTVASEDCCTSEQKSGEKEDDKGDCASTCHSDFAEALFDSPYDIVRFANVDSHDDCLAFVLVDGVNVLIEKPPRLS